MQQTQNILIPKNTLDPSICFATHFHNYLNSVKDFFANDQEGRFRKGLNGGKGFIKANIGHNVLRNVGKDVPNELGIQNWQSYTGHCW